MALEYRYVERVEQMAWRSVVDERTPTSRQNSGLRSSC